MPSPVCKTCDSPDVGLIEADGLRAESGEISWREAARLWNYVDPKTLKNHMVKHFHAVPALDATQDFKDKCEVTARLLEDGLGTLPPEIQALRLIQIHNLRHLHTAKPSTQHLIMASKTEQEMTGMKLGQTLMLTFAEAMFKPAPQELIKVAAILEIEAAGDE